MTPQPIPNDPQRQRFVDIALAEVGTRETGGNNLGEKIREYQSATILAPGPWPWCSAFVCWDMEKWLRTPAARARVGLPNDDKAVEKWRCKSPCAFDWGAWARNRNIPVLPESSRALAGDIVVFDFSHVGIVVEDMERGGVGAIVTVEGNTNGRGDRDSHAGDGVWLKERHWKLAQYFVRWIGPLKAETAPPIETEAA